MSELDARHAELSALRAEIGREFSRISDRLTQVTTDIAVLRARLDAKPSAATVYRAAFSVCLALFVVGVATVIALKVTRFIP